MSKNKTATDVAAVLTAILADTYALAVKTHGAHWNVTGPGFYELHEEFGKQYEALFEAADELAERVRALGATAPGSIGDLSRRSTLPGAPDARDGASLVKILYGDHRHLSKAASAGIAVAQAAGDEASADLLVGRVTEHDKTAWMLGAVAG